MSLLAAGRPKQRCFMDSWQKQLLPRDSDSISGESTASASVPATIRPNCLYLTAARGCSRNQYDTSHAHNEHACIWQGRRLAARHIE